MLKIKELLVDMYECEGDLNDEKFLCETLEAAAKKASAKIIKRIVQRFSPTGISVILILAETHISIHTWPEFRYAALDIFVCGKGKDPDAAWIIVKEALRPRRFKARKIERIVGETPEEPKE